MFVLTVDQVDSRGTAEDAVLPILADHDAWRGRGALLGPDRTAGDEFQLVLGSAPAALDAVLRLTREGGWSIGLGIGAVETPLPETTGAARGGAFVAARAAIDAAKRAPHRFEVVAPDRDAATGVTALVGLLLEVRARRSEEGWQVADLLQQGLSQTAIAERLGVSPQAISLRARTAAVRLEREALPALAAALADLDGDGPLPSPE